MQNFTGFTMIKFCHKSLIDNHIVCVIFLFCEKQVILNMLNANNNFKLAYSHIWCSINMMNLINFFPFFFIDDKKFLVPKLQDSAFRKVITSVIKVCVTIITVHMLIKVCVTIITVHTHKIVTFQNTKPTARMEGDKI